MGKASTRLEAINDASAHLVVFCEYLPKNLLEWLTEQVRSSADAAETAIAFVNAHLAPTIDFMNARGLTHFDTHFENIVTDGQRFCFGDFGLALSSDFELTEDEVAFLARHRRYDLGGDGCRCGSLRRRQGMFHADLAIDGPACSRRWGDGSVVLPVQNDLVIIEAHRAIIRSS